MILHAYRCSETSDLTTVHLGTILTNENAVCNTNEFTPPVLDPASPTYRYYGPGIDKGTVLEECLAATDPERTAKSVSCYLRQDGPDSGADDSTG